MNSHTKLVADLAHQIRKYPRGGGQRPVGMLILQRGNRRLPLVTKRIPNVWPADPAKVKYNFSPLGTALLEAGLEYSGREDEQAYSQDLLESSIPTVVADVLLGLQFDGKKAVASAFRIAEIVSRVLGLELAYEEDFSLGTYLLSCLIKAGYYRHWEMIMDNGRTETALAARKKAILEIPERDAWTAFEPFPSWTSGFDDEHRRLVKPSSPQLKKTYWVPEETEFKSRSRKRGDLSIHTELAAKMVNVWQADNEFDVWKVDASMWIRGVNRLERTAYHINQCLLGILSENPQMWFPKVNNALESEKRRLLKERKKMQRGDEWKSLPRNKRTLEALAKLGREQTKQTAERKEAGDRPSNLPNDDPRRHCSQDLHRIHQDYWVRWQENRKALTAHASKLDKFKKEHLKAEKIGDRVFYNRAFLDHRGRVYLNRSRVNYQAGDLCRGLIEFAEGQQVRKKDWRYLWIHLGNVTGINGDASTKETAAKKRKGQFLRWGKNPARTYDQWKDVSDPWQCIRACIELVELERNPKLKSRLIVEIDQSTSCLQHIAMIRGDRELARRVNLGPEYNDIYLDIAATMQELDDLDDADKRKIIKMVLVPWTYGGNAWSARNDFHTSTIPYLVNMTSRQRLQCACRVQAAIEAELQQAVGYTNEMGSQIDLRISHGQRNALWETPSNFSVCCYKQETDELRERLWVGYTEKDRDKTIRLTAWNPTRRADIAKLKTAIAPNFVHSVDAAVVHMVLAHTPEDQPTVSVHDAFGTHIRNVTDAKTRFAEAFHRIYSSMHPYLIAVGGMPPFAATPPEELLSSDFLQEIKDPPHQTI